MSHEGTEPVEADTLYEELRFANYKRKQLGTELAKHQVGTEVEQSLYERKEFIQSYDDRRAFAMSHGTVVGYLRCPFCSLNRPMGSVRDPNNIRAKITRGGTLKTAFNVSTQSLNIDPDDIDITDQKNIEMNTDEIIQFRVGGGRGIGFFRTETQPPLGLQDLFDKSAPLYYNIKENVLLLVEEINRIEGKKP